VIDQSPSTRLRLLAGSPLAHAGFRALWTASTVSYVGTFVQDIGERWLILDMTQSPLSAAMLATTFVTASLVAMLPSGVLADRMDRRRLVLLSQTAQALVATTVGLACMFHLATPKVLLCAAGAAGLSSALGAPAWSALIAEIVRPEQVADAVTLGAVAFNLARAIGPAVGGVILAAFGPTASFLANAATFVAVIVAVTMTPPPEVHRPTMAPVSRAFSEPFVHATRDAGIRSTFVGMLVFTLGASFVYILAPAFAKLTLSAGPRAYGLILGAMGAGAVIGALLLKPLRQRAAPPPLLGALMTVYGTCAMLLSRVHSVTLAIAICVPAGVGWTGSFSSLSALVQVWTPNRLRARALALYTMLHLGMWALGASLSGVLAEGLSVRATMLIGGAICIVAGFVTSRMPLPRSFVSEA
jgi:MFS family permease